eukprot:1161505-Pelagomonas_calceolata.AAC.4
MSQPRLRKEDVGLKWSILLTLNLQVFRFTILTAPVVSSRYVTLSIPLLCPEQQHGLPAAGHGMLMYACMHGYVRHASYSCHSLLTHPPGQPAADHAPGAPSSTHQGKGAGPPHYISRLLCLHLSIHIATHTIISA